MLYRAAKPEQRYRVLEHFYRLPQPLVGRFYAGRLTFRDKIRVLSGRPPVPVGRALLALVAPRKRPDAAVARTGGRI
jgi:lycopene beta-cyclase